MAGRKRAKSEQINPKLPAFLEQKFPETSPRPTAPVQGRRRNPAQRPGPVQVPVWAAGPHLRPAPCPSSAPASASMGALPLTSPSDVHVEEDSRVNGVGRLSLGGYGYDIVALGRAADHLLTPRGLGAARTLKSQGPRRTAALVKLPAGVRRTLTFRRRLSTSAARPDFRLRYPGSAGA